EEDGDAAEHGDRPRDQILRAPVEPDGERRVAGEDEEPQEERSLLPSPERGERIPEGKRPARVLGDVDEGEIAPRACDEEDDGGHERRRERRKERVLRGEGEAPSSLPRGERAAEERVGHEPEAQEQRCTAEIGHVTCWTWRGCTSTGTSSRASP